MSYQFGSLRDAMERYHEEGHNVAVVVIDEQTTRPTANTAAQQRVVKKAVELGLPVIFVELNPSIVRQQVKPNKPTSRYLQVPNAIVVTKSHFSAFHKEPNAFNNLDYILKQQNVQMLVVMGYNVNQCVRITAVGGSDSEPRAGQHFANAMYHPGATQLGYIVLTCDAVLRGGTASWKMERGVRFYRSA